MKKLVFLLMLAALLAVPKSAFSQFKFGPQAGVPTGDASDYYSFVLGLDAYYMFGNNPDAFLKFGAASGFTNFFGDDIDGSNESIDDAQFIPVAGVARITILDTITFGPDIGYGIGINSGNDGGFYWRLVAGLDLGNVLELHAYYQNTIVDSFNYGAVGAGLLIEL